MGSIKPMIAVPYRASTFGVEVQLAPMYLPEETTLDSLIHVFFYAMRIVNRSGLAITLISRHFRIRDGYGHDRLLEDAGVRGAQHTIAADDHITYSSYCALPTSSGSIRGYLWVAFADGTEGRVDIPVCFLRHQDCPDGEYGLYPALSSAC